MFSGQQLYSFNYCLLFFQVGNDSFGKDTVKNFCNNNVKTGPVKNKLNTVHKSSHLKDDNNGLLLSTKHEKYHFFMICGTGKSDQDRLILLKLPALFVHTANA